MKRSKSSRPTVYPERLAEPATSYNVVRLQRDVRQGTSNVGMIATGVMRQNDFDAFAAGR